MCMCLLPSEMPSPQAVSLMCPSSLIRTSTRYTLSSVVLQHPLCCLSSVYCHYNKNCLMCPSSLTRTSMRYTLSSVVLRHPLCCLSSVYCHYHMNCLMCPSSLIRTSTIYTLSSVVLRHPLCCLTSVYCHYHKNCTTFINVSFALHMLHTPSPTGDEFLPVQHPSQALIKSQGVP